MRYSVEHRKETRARILDAAAQLFRKQGYVGLGVDGLAKAAGVTNGAFYGHFKSKSEAFRTTILDGLEELRSGIVALKANQGKKWLAAFIDFYLGPKRTCDLGQSCALASLSAEVMRADADTRSAYEKQLARIVEEVASGLPKQATDEHGERAIALLALLSGGVTLARAVADPALSERIGTAVARSAQAMISAPAQS